MAAKTRTPTVGLTVAHALQVHFKHMMLIDYFVRMRANSRPNRRYLRKQQRFESFQNMFRQRYICTATPHLRGELVSGDRMDCPRVVEREMGAPDDIDVRVLRWVGSSLCVRVASAEKSGGQTSTGYGTVEWNHGAPSRPVPPTAPKTSKLCPKPNLAKTQLLPSPAILPFYL